METNIVVLGGIAHTRLRAFAAATSVLPRPWSWLRHLSRIPRGPSDWIYDRIARNRYVVGRRPCPMPSAALKARLIG
jgi:predicted DCC family thiol-disulfide oxidoreductase YuxK